MRATATGPDGRSFDIDDEHLASARAQLGQAQAPPVRLAFAAAHVVLAPSYLEVDHSLQRPGRPDEIAPHLDLDTTMALRRHLDAHGFGVAEAMDTAQRFHLGWQNAERLIRACGDLRLRHGFVAGAGVDHLPAIRGKDDLAAGVVYQVEAIQASGGIAMILPMAWLAQTGASVQDYVDVYGAIFAACTGPLFVHWLGDMFLPALAGYFPGDSFARVMALSPDKVRGCKLSLLDADFEKRVRAELLPRDQIVLTGDDWNFADLIAGDDSTVRRHTRIGAHDVALGEFSHALLGVFDGVAVPAGLALQALAQERSDLYGGIMRPCEGYGRVVFEPPTQHYKAGLAFTAWLNGLQADFTLVNHEEKSRDHDHYLRVAAAATRCGALTDARLAASRLRALESGSR
ncbi:MAG: DUF993 family protein [Planctomycetota bacterium]